MPVYVPTLWSVGQRLKATALNVVVNAITELQAGSARVYYEQAQTVGSIPNITTTPVLWSSASGFTTGGAWGLKVPTDGIYSASVTWSLQGGNTFSAGKCSVEIRQNGTILSRGATQVGVGETYLGHTTVVRCTAADEITPYFVQNTGGAVTNSICTLRLTRLAI